MKCPNCGQSLSPPLFSSHAVVVGNFICGACGYSIPAGEPRRRTMRGKYILAIGLLAIVVTVLLIVFGR